MSRSTLHFLIRKPVSCVVTKPKWLYMSMSPTTENTWEVHRGQKIHLKQLDHSEYKRIAHQCTTRPLRCIIYISWSKTKITMVYCFCRTVHGARSQNITKNHPVCSRPDCSNTYLSIDEPFGIEVVNRRLATNQHCPHHLSLLVCIS